MVFLLVMAALAFLVAVAFELNVWAGIFILCCALLPALVVVLALLRERE